VTYLQDIDTEKRGFGTFYDELPLWSAPFGLLLLERVPLRRGWTYLDVGAGTGFLSLELAQRCGPETTVIAVDPWGRATARLREKIARLGIGNVRVLEADAAEMGLPDASVDAVVSNLGINNFENAGAVLAACHRAARPGAPLCLTTNLTGHMSEFYDVFRETLVELGRTDRLASLDAHIARRGTVLSVSRLLEDAGFGVESVHERAFPMRFADGSALLRHAFVRLGFLSGWKSVAGPESLEVTFQALEGNLNARARRDGELGLTIPWVCVEARRSAA
jgi:arsenite methyltransferase